MVWLGLLCSLFAVDAPPVDDGATPKKKEPVALTRYFDIPVGTIIEYAVSGDMTGGQTLIMHTEITKNERVDEELRVSVTQSFRLDGNDVAQVKQIFRVTETSVIQESREGGEVSQQVLIQSPVKKDHAWDDTAEGIPMRYTIIQVGAERVLARKMWTDVLVVEQKIDFEGAEQTTISSYAPGVGLFESRTTGVNRVDVTLRNVTPPGEKDASNGEQSPEEGSEPEATDSDGSDEVEPSGGGSSRDGNRHSEAVSASIPPSVDPRLAETIPLRAMR